MVQQFTILLNYLIGGIAVANHCQRRHPYPRMAETGKVKRRDQNMKAITAGTTISHRFIIRLNMTNVQFTEDLVKQRTTLKFG